uniref:Uncharacterized protein n=1 Tax=viral metagenome TaxID=1070528 RepID=A0A6C0HBE3_9ZZZZ
MRCPKGFRQQPPKSGICVKNNTSKRCAKGTRKNKKTGKCEKHTKQSKSKKMNKTPEKVMKQDKIWKIYKIDYVYPTIIDEKKVDRSDYGSINIENIFIENEENVVQITFENTEVEAFMGKKQDKHPRIVWDDNTIHNIKDLNIDINTLDSNKSNIVFFGTGNDDDGNNTERKNVDLIKRGAYGKYVNINDTYPNLDSEYIDDTIKDQILEKSIEVIKQL